MSLMRVISLFVSVFRGRDYYRKYKRLYKRDLREIPSFNLISIFAHGKILDIGCGIGYLSNLFHDYVGIDINKEAITIAKKNTRDNYIVASATDLPFHHHAFETCVSYDFIEHVKNFDRVLAEMKRVSDKAIISCVDFSSYYRLFTYDKTHQILPSPNELATSLTQYFAYVRLFKTSGLFMVPRLLNVFLSKYLPNQIVLEALSLRTKK